MGLVIVNGIETSREDRDQFAPNHPCSSDWWKGSLSESLYMGSNMSSKQFPPPCVMGEESIMVRLFCRSGSIVDAGQTFGVPSMNLTDVHDSALVSKGTQSARYIQYSCATKFALGVRLGNSRSHLQLQVSVVLMMMNHL
jgi:hypothetical protein